MTDHQRKIVDAYKAGLTLREVGDEFGISYKRVHFIITECDPGALRLPNVIGYPRCRWPQRERTEQNWLHWYQRVNATAQTKIGQDSSYA